MISGEEGVGRILDGELVRVVLSELRPFSRNPRRGDVAAIRESLEANKQYKPLIANRRTMEVLVGNHTLAAARELGWPEVMVQFVDVDDDHARRIALADNRTSDLAGYDEEELAALLGEFDDLTGTGFDEVFLGDLLDGLSADVPLEDDEVAPAPAEPITRPGELITLGEHRLVCGDARDPRAYERLLGGEAANLLWTDPPYGVAYVGKTRERLRIANDTAEGLEALLVSAFTCADRVLVEGAPVYLAHPSGPQAATFMAAFVEAGWSLRQTLVWVKDTMVLGHADYHYRHEPLLYGFRPGPGRLGRGGEGWYGGNRQTSVLEVPRPRASREHPTPKPPELIAIALRNSLAGAATWCSTRSPARARPWLRVSGSAAGHG